MVIAVIVSVTAEARVAGIVMMLQRFLVVMVVVVVRVDGDGNWDLHRHRDVFLHGDVLLDGHRVGAIDGELNRDGDGLLDGVWNLVGGERCCLVLNHLINSISRQCP